MKFKFCFSFISVGDKKYKTLSSRTFIEIKIPIIKTNDATKRSKKNIIFKNIKRDSLSFAQTPQGFDFKKIYTKHQENKNLFFDDDSSLFTEYDEKVLTINGYKSNFFQ